MFPDLLLRGLPRRRDTRGSSRFRRSPMLQHNRQRAAGDRRQGGRVGNGRRRRHGAPPVYLHRSCRAPAPASMMGKWAPPHSGRDFDRASGSHPFAPATRLDRPSAAPHAPSAVSLPKAPRAPPSAGLPASCRSTACKPKWVAMTRSTRSPIRRSASIAPRGSWPATVRSIAALQVPETGVRIALPNRSEAGKCRCR